jgi:nitrate reductase NapD
MFDRKPEEDLLPGREKKLPADDGPEIHFTSLLVSCTASEESAVAGEIARDGRAEVRSARTRGKLIVTLETESLGDVTEFLDRVERLPGVMNAAMVYHHAESADLVDEIIDVDAAGAPSSDKTGVTP